MGKLGFNSFIFQGDTIVNTPQTNPLLNPEQWDCPVAIFTHSDLANSESNRKLLSSMMKACKLTSEQYKIIPSTTVYQQLLSFGQLKYILLFGLYEKELNLNVSFPFYEPTWLHQRIWIKAHSLEELNKKSEYKKILWERALKKTFL